MSYPWGGRKKQMPPAISGPPYIACFGICCTSTASFSMRDGFSENLAYFWYPPCPRQGQASIPIHGSILRKAVRRSLLEK
ncbi:hypothetical protein BDV26DRAFT_253649 [Aspergillus bertholletiae]|uniref:Uncharacterized protein n=1 Tax=Aspergillus bertholletiae TaxID=1226010 RepID=A0A5N7BL20_9EURO|nr:hypothetical protein BDV26DRAFT_253649 [Aspergillus bertholletiae]